MSENWAIVFKHVEGNIVTIVELDTRSVLSFLPDVAYDALEHAVKKLMVSKKKTEFIDKPYLCLKEKFEWWDCKNDN